VKNKISMLTGAPKQQPKGSWALIIAFITLLSLMGGRYAASETEPNDSFAQADAVVAGNHSGVISYLGDQDYFSFVVIGNGNAVGIGVYTGFPVSFDSELFIYNGAGVQIGHADSNWPEGFHSSAPQEKVTLTLNAGTYYARVLAWNNGETGAYTLGLTVPDRIPPAVNSFVRQNPNAEITNVNTLVFRATFSENVRNVDITDFTVNSAANATVTSVSTVTSDTVFDITVSGGNLAGFNGTVGLDLANSQNITDVEGNSLQAGEPGTDETYTLENAEPSVITLAATAISSTSANLGGDVTDEGISSVTDRGVVFSSTDYTPQIGEVGVTQSPNGISSGTFSKAIETLTPNAQYWFSAYATNSLGTSYGSIETFTTNKLTQTITFNPLAYKIYGDPDFSLQATASSTLTVSYSSSNIAVATVSGNTVTIVGTGTTTITASQVGNEIYDAVSVDQKLDVYSVIATSAQEGNWNDSATWTQNAIPVIRQNVSIEHDVLLDINAEIKSLSIVSSKILTLDGTELVVNGTFDASAGGMTIVGNGVLQILGTAGCGALGSFASGTGTVLYAADSDQSVDAVNYYKMVLGGSGIKTLCGNTMVDSDLTISMGTIFDVGTPTAFSLNVAGDWINNGTFEPREGTVTLDGEIQALIGSTSFYSLIKETTSKTELIFEAGSTTTITDELILQGSINQLLSLRSNLPGSQWSINSVSSRILSYLDVQDSNSINSSFIDVVGANCRDSGNNKNWVFVNYLPVVTTQIADSITATSATGHGNITTLGYPYPTAHGLCWSKSQELFPVYTCRNNGAVTGIGNYSSLMTGLEPATEYNAWAFATNVVGTVYGDAFSFITLCSTPVTNGVSNLNVDGFKLSWGAVAGAQTYLLDLSTSPTFDNYLQGYEAKDLGNVTDWTLDDLEPCITYYYRVYAVNAAGQANIASDVVKVKTRCGNILQYYPACILQGIVKNRNYLDKD